MPPLFTGRDMVTNKKTGTEYIHIYPSKPQHHAVFQLSHTHTHTISQSSYTGFNSLNRSLLVHWGIGTEIPRHVVHFLHRSFSLIEVDGLWSWWACESKTCAKTRLGVTHGWRHADVIHIRQREIYPRVKWLNEVTETQKNKKQKNKQEGEWV